MTDHDSESDLGEEVRERLSAMRTDLEPPANLESRVLAALRVRSRESTRSHGSPFGRPLAILAVGAALLFAGILIGRRATEPRASSPTAARYVLFLEGPDEPDAQAEARRVRDYKAWAGGVAAQGRLVLGEKLSPDYHLLGPADTGPSGGATVRGLFVITASDDVQALAIARGCPHLRYGGRIVLRKVAPV